MHGGGIDPLVRAAGDAGATGIHLAGGLVLADLEGVIPAIVRAGLEVSSMRLPLAPRALGPRKRLPALAASDPDERAAAIALALEGLDAGVAAGVRWALLDLGTVTLPVSRAELGGLFARRELDRGEAGASELELGRDVRKALSERLSDACRWSLERLARPAESRGVTLALPAGGSLWDVPSMREALGLLDAFRGAPLGLLWAPARLMAARALGLNLPDERVAAVAAAAAAALETDAVGLDSGYLPGLGERDDALPARPELPRDAPIIVSGYPDSTDAEIARAFAAVTARYEKPVPAP